MVLFDALRNAVISRLFIALFYLNEHVTLDLEACDLQVGYVFSQKHPADLIRPISNRSRLLNDAEQRYNRNPSAWPSYGSDLLFVSVSRGSVYNLKKSWFTPVDSQLGRQHRLPCQMATAPVQIRFRRCT